VASIAVKAVAIVVWGGFMAGMASWSYTDAAMIGAGLGTVLLGVLVGRWWVLLVPIVLGGAARSGNPRLRP
jgi:hypothetical protein